MSFQQVVDVAHHSGAHPGGLARQALSFHGAAYDGQDGRDVPVKLIEPELCLPLPQHLQVAGIETGNVDDSDGLGLSIEQ
jgi:hypothetical protein